MASTSDMKLPSRPYARTTKQILALRNHPFDSGRHDHTYGLFTKGSRITGDSSNREKTARHSHTPQSSIKGMTLEDYIRGRTANDVQATQLEPSAHRSKETSVIRFKQEESGMCFDQTFEIEEEDEDNYSQNRNQQLVSGFLPDIKVQHNRLNRHIKHVQTEACDEPSDYSPQFGRPNRLMTSYNEQLFLPIHSLGRDKPQLRRSFYRRDQRSKSNTQKEEEAQLMRNRSKEVKQSAAKIGFKTNTMSDFYRPIAPAVNSLEKNIRVDLGYVTKYGNKFRLNPVLEVKQRLHRRQLN